MNWPDITGWTDGKLSASVNPSISTYSGVANAGTPEFFMDVNGGGMGLLSLIPQTTTDGSVVSHIQNLSNDGPSVDSAFRLFSASSGWKAAVSFSSIGVHIDYGLMDEVAPSVSENSPVADATNVSRTSTIRMRFSEYMDPVSLADHVGVTGSKSGTCVCSFSYSHPWLTITPLRPFAGDDQVTVNYWSALEGPSEILPPRALNPNTVGVQDLRGRGIGVGSFSFDTLDDVPPQAPPGIVVSGDSGSVDLGWTEPTHDEQGFPETGLAGYHVYRMAPPQQQDYVKVNSSLITSTSYTDSGLSNLRDYYYKITAVDTAGNESDLSFGIKVTPTQFPGPTTITGGDYYSDQTWLVGGSPYVIDGNVRFLNGAKLTLEKGVEIKVSGNYSIDINGSLEASGTSSEPIVFRSATTDAPAGAWKGLKVRSHSGDESGILEHFVIRDAVRGLELIGTGMEVRDGKISNYSEMGMRLNNSNSLVENVDLRIPESQRWAGTGVVVDGGNSPTLKNLQITWSITGISVDNSAPLIDGVSIKRTRDNAIYGTKAANYSLINSEIYENYGYGLRFSGSNATINARITENKIFGNVKQPLLAESHNVASVIDARGNYWGYITPNEVASVILDRSDNNNGALVTYLDLRDVNLVPVSASLLQGTYSSDTTLTVANSPYHVTGNVVFEQWCTIEPGVEVIIDGDYEMRFKWVIKALGTEDLPIKFHYLGATPAPSSWKGLVIDSTVSAFDCVVDYLQISDALTGVDSIKAAVTYNNLTISNCATGLVFSGATAGEQIPVLADSVIEDCTGWGVKLLSSHATVRGCNIRDCSSGGAYLDRSNGTLDDCNLWQTGVNVGSGTGVYALTNLSDTYANQGGNAKAYFFEVKGTEVHGFQNGVNCYKAQNGTFSGSKIYANATDGMVFRSQNNYVLTSPNPVINGCEIYGNGRYALYQSGPTWSSLGNRVIDATGNWWGSGDPVAIASAVYDKSDDANRPTVNVTPFLASQLLKGDFNLDRVIGFSDLDAFSRCYGTISTDDSYDERGDFDNDGVIDIDDLDDFSRIWGRTF